MLINRISLAVNKNQTKDLIDFIKSRNSAADIVIILLDTINGVFNVIYYFVCVCLCVSVCGCGCVCVYDRLKLENGCTNLHQTWHAYSLLKILYKG
jgi:hypothetical protein